MTSTADQYTVRQHNTALILSTLRQNETLSRAEIAARTGLNRSTVSSIINELLEEKAIEETILQSEKIGRPGMLLKLNPGYGFTVGIDVNVDYITAVMMDYTYTIMWEKTIPVVSPTQQETLLQQAIDLTHTAVDLGKNKNMKVLGIGVVIPGLVDTYHGVLIMAPNLGWENVPLKAIWQAHFDCPIFVENDANAAALGEFYIGEAKAVQNFICINVGVGIGGGIVIDGSLMRGARGFASEVGHMVVEPDGKPCGCGSRGCLETVIGNIAILASVKETLRSAPPVQPFTSEASIQEITLRQIVEAAIDGHPVCQTALRKVGYHLGLVVGSLVNIFNPELVIIGGYSHEMVVQILPELRRTARSHIMRVSRKDLDIRPSRFGVSSSVIGAASLVFEHLTQPVF
ncbi:MAG: ROK family transcriptional regulator [Anaerolineae bacterium]|jgi:glucokinase-like ROK family protein|nr:ROK family transcriptional regulator [Anaerolineae bacterium]